MWTGGPTGTHGRVCLQSQCVWVMELNNFDFGAPLWTFALDWFKAEQKSGTKTVCSLDMLYAFKKTFSF